MKKIQMVDLGSQYQNIQEEIDKAVLDVIKSTAYINGPEVKKLQENLEKYLDVKHVIPCANGTDALQVSLMALGLKPGDEVISVDFTFAATVEVIGLLNLTPVLVDVDEKTFNIDIEALKAAITPKTKAIIPVHLFGQVANMEEIMAIAKEHNLAVVEDTAQAIGAEFTFSDGSVKKAGTIGDLGTTSFFPSKNLGGYGDGGAVFTNSDELAHKLRGIVNHGMYRRYYHDEVGVNSRLDSIQAAILNVKLAHLDTYNCSRYESAMKYSELFETCDKIETPYIADNSTHVFHQYTLKVKGVDRNALQEHCMANGFPAMIYYPVPLHAQEAYKDDRYNEDDFKVTNELIHQVISLPMHSELEDDQIEFMAKTVLDFVNK